MRLVDENAALLHAGKDFGQRQFHFAIQLHQVGVVQRFFIARINFFQSRNRCCRVGAAEFHIARRPVAFGVKQISRKFRVENFFKVGDFEAAQIIFHVAQNYFAREVVKDFLHVVRSRGVNFSAENFHGELIIPLRER